MAYVKKIWINDSTPLNAENLNHIEEGIFENSIAIENIEANEITEEKVEEIIDSKDFATTEEVNTIVEGKGYTTEEQVSQMINQSIITALNTEV